MPLDFSILDRIQKPKNELAWEEFREALEGTAIGSLINKGLSEDVAKDLYSNTVYVILQRKKNNVIKNEHDNFEAYFMKTLNGQRLNYLKVENPIYTDSIEQMVSISALEYDYEKDSNFTKVLLKVNEISPNFRHGTTVCGEIIQRHIINAQRIIDIAKEKGLEPNTLTQHLRRCLSSIRDAIEKSFESEQLKNLF